MKYSTVAILTSDDKSWSGYNSCNYFKYSVITHCAALHLLRANEQVRDYFLMLRSAHNETMRPKIIFVHVTTEMFSISSYSVHRID